MSEETDIIMQLVETIGSAIISGDWKVDGVNDPDAIMRRACAYLEQMGYVPDCVTGETFIRV